MKITNASGANINSLFKNKNIPIIMLAGGYQTSFGVENIAGSFKNVFYSPPSPLFGEVEHRVRKLLEQSEKKRFKFFNDTLARLDCFRQNQNGKLSIVFSKTTYFHFAALNKCLDEPISGEKHASLRSFLQENPAELEKSKLPNPLGVIVSLILEPEMKIVLAKRSTRNFEGSGVMSTPIGGSLSLGSGDVDDSGIPNPFKTVVREAKEEIGIDLSETQITFFGLGRDLLTLKPELLGEVRINLTEKELRQIWQNKPIDWWEAEEKIFVDLSPEKLSPYLKDYNWSAAGWACTLMSMLRQKHSPVYDLDL